MQFDANEVAGPSGMPGGEMPSSAADSSDTEARTPEGADREATGRVPPSRRRAERAAAFRSDLADRLQQGAERLRRRAAAIDVEGPGAERRGQLKRAGHRVADGMENTAGWVRRADARTVRADLEEQVRTRPGRTLLIALGVGYLLGRVLRGRRQA